MRVRSASCLDAEAQARARGQQVGSDDRIGGGLDLEVVQHDGVDDLAGLGDRAHPVPPDLGVLDEADAARASQLATLELGLLDGQVQAGLAASAGRGLAQRRRASRSRRRLVLELDVDLVLGRSSSSSSSTRRRVAAARGPRAWRWPTASNGPRVAQRRAGVRGVVVQSTLLARRSTPRRLGLGRVDDHDVAALAGHPLEGCAEVVTGADDLRRQPEGYGERCAVQPGRDARLATPGGVELGEQLLLVVGADHQATVAQRTAPRRVLDVLDRAPRQPAPGATEPDPHALRVGDQQRRAGVDEAVATSSRPAAP